MSTESKKIKELVKERYGARAKRVIELSPIQEVVADHEHGGGCGCDADTGCCGPIDLEHAARLYKDSRLAGLPVDSVAASAGCGNPTALAGLREGERVLDLGSGGGIDCFLAAQHCVVCLSPDKDAVFSESFRVLAPGGRIHLSDVLALTSDGPAVTDAESWVACTAGAEYKDVYLERLRRAGFVDLEIDGENNEFRADEQAMATNTASFKVVAHKPA